MASRIEHYLPQQLLGLIRSISGQAQKSEQKVYLVGGVIRDMLLGYPNFDLDLVVEGNAIKLAQQVAELSQLKSVVHPRFQTAKLSYGIFTIDIATARHETYSKPGALPTINPGTINDDLSRRDFSINAMAISLAPENYGELVDIYQGKSDLKRSLIRILHPKSFTDDATRILRAIRYEQRLGFKLEAQTAQLLKRDIPILDTISGDRIRHELELILGEERPEHAINRLSELGALQRINPALRGNDWIVEKFDDARRLNKPSQLPSLYFSLLSYPLDGKEIEEIICRLNMPVKLARILRDTLRLRTQLPLLDEPTMKHSEIYYLLHDYDPLAIQVNAIATKPSTPYHHLQQFLVELRYVKTHLGGEDLKKLGIPEGPDVGKILQTMHKAKLDKEVNTREEEEKLALLLKHNCLP